MLFTHIFDDIIDEVVTSCSDRFVVNDTAECYDGYFTFEVGGIFKPFSQRRPYEADTRLAKPPLALKQAAERFLYELGKCVLEAYSCFEE